MHCLVIGAGIVGLSTAYLLKDAGFEVTIVDKAEEVGGGTSYANGAQLSYSYVAPLAGPGVVSSLPKYLLDPESPLRFRPELSIAQWAWCLRFLLACNREKSERSIRYLYELADLSRFVLDGIVAKADADFDYRANGKLVVYDSAASLEKARQDMGVLASLGCRQSVLDRQQCLDLEPGLDAIGHRILGGVFSPEDASGDCRKLCQWLAEAIAAGPSGAYLASGSEVRRLLTDGDAISGVETTRGILTADIYILAAGMETRSLGRSAGLDMPLYPLGGYSLTADIADEAMAPSISVTDFGRKTVYARIGNRIRSAAFVEIGGAVRADTRRIEQLIRNSGETYGRVADFSQAEVWRGFRPATPDGLPLNTKTRYRNLFLNAGHGALGFTLAFGSARRLVDAVTRNSG